MILKTAFEKNLNLLKKKNFIKTYKKEQSY